MKAQDLAAAESFLLDTKHKAVEAAEKLRKGAGKDEKLARAFEDIAGRCDGLATVTRERRIAILPIRERWKQ